MISWGLLSRQGGNAFTVHCTPVVSFYRFLLLMIPNPNSFELSFNYKLIQISPISIRQFLQKSSSFCCNNPKPH